MVRWNVNKLRHNQIKSTKIKRLERKVKRLKRKEKMQENNRVYYNELAEVAEKYVNMKKTNGIVADMSGDLQQYLNESERWHNKRVETLLRLNNTTMKLAVLKGVAR